MQEVYAPKDMAIPVRPGGGFFKESVVRELPSIQVIH